MDRCDVRSFGAKGDGRTDDTQAVQTALDTNSRVFFPKGVYIVDNIRLRPHRRLYGEGSQSILMQKSGAAYGLSVNPGHDGSADPLENICDVEIRNLCLQGTVRDDGFSQHAHLMNINGVSDLLIETCLIRGWRGDGVYIGSGNEAGLERHNKRVSIKHCVFDGERRGPLDPTVRVWNRNCISVIDCDHLTVQDCFFSDASCWTMPGGIDIQPDANSFHVVQRIRICDNSFINVGNAGISIVLPYRDFALHPGDIVISGNSISYTITGLNCVGFAAEPTLLEFGIIEGVIFSNNTTYNVESPFMLSGAAGIKIIGNFFREANQHSAVGGMEAHQRCANIDLVGNSFLRCGKAGGTGLTIGKVQGVMLAGNTFTSCGQEQWGYAIQLVSECDSDYLTINGNVFYSIERPDYQAIVQQADHSTGSHITVTGNAFNGLGSVFPNRS